jgi:hypothetical protein
VYSAGYVGLHQPGQFNYLIECIQIKMDSIPKTYYKPATVDYKLVGLGVLSMVNIGGIVLLLKLGSTSTSTPSLTNGGGASTTPVSTGTTVNVNIGNNNNFGAGNGPGNGGVGNNSPVTEWLKVIGPAIGSFFKSLLTRKSNP